MTSIPGIRFRRTSLEVPRPPVSRPRWGGSLRFYRAPALFALLAAGVIALAWTAPRETLDALARAVAWLQAHDSERGRAVLTTVLASLALLGFVLGWARASSRRRPLRIEGGRGTMGVGDAADALRALLLVRDDVADAVVRVENRHRGRAAVTAEVTVAAHARLAETLAGVERVAAELLTERIGVRMAGTPEVTLRYEELDLRAGRVDAGRDPTA